MSQRAICGVRDVNIDEFEQFCLYYFWDMPRYHLHHNKNKCDLIYIHESIKY